MSSFKFLHAADLHLDSPLRGLAAYEGAPVESMRQASREALKNLVNLAMDDAVSFVLIAGDVYDGDWRDYGTGLFFASQMSRLDEKGIPVFLIQGNHDANSIITKKLNLPGNVRQLSHKKPETVHIDVLDVAIHGRGFETRAETSNFMTEYPAAVRGMFNIGMLHTSATGRPGHDNYAPCTVEELQGKGYDYWALGHVHTHETLAENPWIVFPGNIQGRHAREIGAKGCVVVEVEDRQVDSVVHKPLDVARWCVLNVGVEGVDSVDDLLKHIESHVETAVDGAEDRILAVRLVLTGRCSFHADLTKNRDQFLNNCRTAVSSSSHGYAWLEKVKDETSAIDNSADLLDEGPLLKLVERFRMLQENEQEREPLLAEFDDLKAKIAGTVKDTEIVANFEDPVWKRRLMIDVEEMLRQQLQHPEVTA